MTDFQGQALILRKLYLKALLDFAEAMKSVALHKREHDTWPGDAKEIFEDIRKRMEVLKLAMKTLREEHGLPPLPIEERTDVVPRKHGHFDGVVVPDNMPWSI